MSSASAYETMQITHAEEVSGFVEGRESLIPCDRPGIEQYFLTISHYVLLATNDEGGEVVPHRAAAPDLVIDLYHVQRPLRYP
jgi:hypothetical protein